ncbi:hypothetical protein DP49_4932 [Burkholderia pseudomallei]|nr:hypothetical protein DP49_4932 [Burkholderia pseudomallei]
MNEFVEDPGQHVFRNADPGIVDDDLQLPLARRTFPHRKRNADPPALGKLHRIAQQIHQHLTQPCGVRVQRLRHAMLDEDVDARLASRCIRTHQFNRALHQLARIEVGRGRRVNRGVHAHVIDKPVEHADQMLGAIPRDRHLSALQRIQRRAFEQLQHTEHAVHRDAHFVADHRKQRRLRLVRGFGGLFRAPQFFAEARVAPHAGEFLAAHALGAPDLLQADGEHGTHRDRQRVKQRPRRRAPPAQYRRQPQHDTRAVDRARHKAQRQGGHEPEQYRLHRQQIRQARHAFGDRQHVDDDRPCQ